MEEELQSSGPDLANARHQAKALLKSSKVSQPPVVLNDLMPIVKQKFDITIRGLPDAAFNSRADAMTQIREGFVFIVYNQARSEVRNRFSVAHELGHLFRGHLHGNSSIDLNSNNYDELEANTFAAFLLMPPVMLRKDIKSGTKPEDLAKLYNVSLDAMWWHLKNTGLFNLYK